MLDKKNIINKLLIIGLVLGVVFLIDHFVLAWTPPTATPPNNNVDAPLNVGPTGQSKEGGLVLNTSGATNGLIVQNGKVLFGTTSSISNLLLRVMGRVGATEYCDENGANCFDAASGGGGGGGYWTDAGDYIYVNNASGKVGAVEYCDLNGGNCFSSQAIGFLLGSNEYSNTVTLPGGSGGSWPGSVSVSCPVIDGKQTTVSNCGYDVSAWGYASPACCGASANTSGSGWGVINFFSSYGGNCPADPFGDTCSYSSDSRQGRFTVSQPNSTTCVISGVQISFVGPCSNGSLCQITRNPATATVKAKCTF